MSTSAFPFLDGRTALDGPIARAPRHRSIGVGDILRLLRPSRWVHRATLRQ